VTEHKDKDKDKHKEKDVRHEGLSLRKRVLADGTARFRFRIDLRWQGWPRVVLTYANRTLADADKARLLDLRANGRRDLLEAIAEKRTTIADLLVAARDVKGGLVAVPAPPAGPAPTVGDLHARWLAYLEPRTARSPKARRPYAPGTKENYREHLRAVIAALPRGGRTLAAKFDRDAVELSLTTVAFGTKNRRITAIQAWARWCREKAKVVLPITPSDFHDLKDEEPKGDTAKALTETELAAIMAHTAPEWARLWLVLARTGLRIDECQTLRASAITQGGVAITVPKGKSARAKRTIPVLDPLAREVLDELAAAAPTPQAHLWPPTMRSYSAARARWERACKHAGLSHTDPRKTRSPRRPPKVAPEDRKVPAGRLEPRKAYPLPRPLKSLHGLRHTYGVQLSTIGAPAHLMRQWMGHGSSDLTARYTAAAAEAQDIARLVAAWEVLGPNATPIATTKPQLQLPAGSGVEVTVTPI
jgi:integrase